MWPSLEPCDVSITVCFWETPLDYEKLTVLVPDSPTASFPNITRQHKRPTMALLGMSSSPKTVHLRHTEVERGSEKDRELART